MKAADVTLDFVEIGNKPDFYGFLGARNDSFDVQAYVDQWTEFATNVSIVGYISSSSHTKFVGCAFAASTHNDTGFSTETAFDAVLLDSKAGSQIKLISQHHYMSFCVIDCGLQDLMDKTYIRSNFSSFEPDIALTRSKGIPLVLGETNSFPLHGSAGVSNTAGAAIWALDYSLFAPHVGIERLHFHEGTGFKYNFIQPIALNVSTLDGTPLPTPDPPHIQPAYYAAIIAAEAIGSSGATKSAELNIDDAHISGYHFMKAALSNEYYSSTPLPTSPVTRSGAQRI